MKICLIRHGQTGWNAAGRWQGRSDVPLNEVGMEQAAHTGQALCKAKWDGIFCSELTRARQTAQAIADACGMAAPTPVKDVWERSFGPYEGMYYSDPNCPTWEQVNTDPAVESQAALADRMERALRGLCQEHSGQNIALVSHGSALRVLFGRLFGPEYDIRLVNCSISMVEYREGAFRMLDFNMTAEEFEEKYGR